MRRISQLVVLTAICAVTTTALLPSVANAGSDDERRLGGKVVARQPRTHRMVHEFNLGVGILPLDALYTGLSLGGSYTLHLSDLFALELIDFRYSANIDSGLRRRLADTYEVSPTISPEVEYIAGTGLLFTPLFGKVAFFDQTVARIATHIGVSGGIAHFSDGFRFQLSGGPGVRLFFSDRVSSRLDIRGTIAFDDQLSAETLLQVNLSVAFNFGSVRATEKAAGGADEVDPEQALKALFPDSDPQPRPE